MLNRIKSNLVLLSLIMIVAVPIFWLGMYTAEQKVQAEIERLNNKIISDRSSVRQRIQNERSRLQDIYTKEVAQLAMMCKGAAQNAASITESVSESEKAQAEAVKKAIKGKK